MKTIREFAIKGKRILVRCDFNVPLDGQGEILDDFRIKAALPTIQYLLENEAKIILMSHLGRPEGKVVESLRLTPVQDRLTEYLDVSVTKAQDCIGEEIEKWTKEMMSGEILLLENLRFHKEEEEGDPEFAKALAQLGDIYINDAFGASHRAHASIAGIPGYLPAGAGFLLEKEVKILSDLLANPKKPMTAIIGGVKIEDKAKAVDRISEAADFILIGTVIQEEIEKKQTPLKYPQKIIKPIDGPERNGRILDIGPKTIELFKEKIAQSQTVFWSGPLGKIEEAEFAIGSREIARAIVESGAFSVAGGGETAEFINRIGLAEKFNHLSTGGGAMLEFLSGEKLPGIEILL